MRLRPHRAWMALLPVGALIGMAGAVYATRAPATASIPDLRTALAQAEIVRQNLIALRESMVCAADATRNQYQPKEDLYRPHPWREFMVASQQKETAQQIAEKPAPAADPSQNPDTPQQPQSGDDPTKSVHVRGYYRKDGTYVHPYNRRPPRR